MERMGEDSSLSFSLRFCSLDIVHGNTTTTTITTITAITAAIALDTRQRHRRVHIDGGIPNVAIHDAPAAMPLFPRVSHGKVRRGEYGEHRCRYARYADGFVDRFVIVDGSSSTIIIVGYGGGGGVIIVDVVVVLLSDNDIGSRGRYGIGSGSR